MNSSLLSNFVNTAGSLALVGVISSFVIQFLKQHFGGNNKTIAILAIVSVVFGGAYFFFQHLINWELFVTDILGVLSAANAFYTLAIQWFEVSQPVVVTSEIPKVQAVNATPIPVVAAVTPAVTTNETEPTVTNVQS